jgi:hypothetical protein
MIDLIKLIGSVLAALLMSIVGNEAHANCSPLARRLIATAAKWYPENERQDFIDEMSDLVDCYQTDGRHLRALGVGINEWRKAAISHGLPTWLHSEQSDRAASGVAYGVAFGVARGSAFGVVFGVVFGVAFGVAFEAAFGAAFGVAYRVVFGMVPAVVSGVASGSASGSASEVASGVAFIYGPTIASSLMSAIRRKVQVNNESA